VIFTRFLFGIFVFLPINGLTSFYEYKLNAGFSAIEFIKNQVWNALTLRTPIKFFFYLIFGGLLGTVVSFVLSLFMDYI
jgi:hypothetical protein